MPQPLRSNPRARFAFWQAVGWGGLTAVFAVAAAANGKTGGTAVWLVGANVTVGLGLTTGLAVLLQWFRWAGRAVGQLVPVFLLAAFTAGLAHLLLAMLPGLCGAGDWDFVGFVSPTVSGVIRGTVLYLLWSLIFVVGSLTSERVEARRRTEALQQEVREAELRLLLDQLDPHFLFNVLMLVQAEADDPDRVRELVLRISQYLRTAIGRGSPMLPVGRQADECLAYLQLQRARFDESLSWRIAIEPDAAGVLLPRLTVQTLVEHAVHDSFEASGEATEILVTARLERDQLLLEVVYPSSQERLASCGLSELEDEQSQGLKDLCRRLELLFGPEACLRLAAGDGLATASIQSPVPRHSTTMPARGVLADQPSSAP
jgi:hypothetical protein